MGVGAGLYKYGVVVKRSRSLSHRLEYRPGVWHDCANRGRGLLFEEIRHIVSHSM